MNILSSSSYLVILLVGMGGWIAFAGYTAWREWRAERQRGIARMRGPWSWWRERLARKRETETLLRIVALLQEHERDLRNVFVGLHEVYYDALLMQLRRERDEPPPERETNA